MFLLAAGFFAQTASAISDRTGMEGAQFLRLGAGARAAALGEAFSAVACGPEALYWNPAGLARLQAPGLAVSHAEYLGIFRHETIYVASPSVRLNGVLGLGLSYMTQDSIEAFDKNGTATGESFRPGSMFFSAGYARALSSGPLSLDAGASLTLLRESLWNDSAFAFALDLGVQAVHERAPGWRAGAALRHLGSREKFVNRPASLPTELDLGLAYEPQNKWKNWTISGEAAVPYYAPAHAKLGLERRIAMKQGTILAVRGGYNTRTLSSLGSMSSFSFGLGLALKRALWNFSFNNQGDLGSVYRFGFGWQFGSDTESVKIEEVISPVEKPAGTPVQEVQPVEKPVETIQPMDKPAEIPVKAVLPEGTLYEPLQPAGQQAEPASLVEKLPGSAITKQ